jgi:hypothetical protein
VAGRGRRRAVGGVILTRGLVAGLNAGNESLTMEGRPEVEGGSCQAVQLLEYNGYGSNPSHERL